MSDQLELEHTPKTRLSDLPDAEVDRRARRHLTALLAADRRGLRAARATGRWLLVHKKRLGHGKLGPWLEANFPGSDDVAQEAMRIAKHWDVIAGWLAENPALGKTAALRRLSRHLRAEEAPAQPPPAEVAGATAQSAETADAASAAARLTKKPAAAGGAKQEFEQQREGVVGAIHGQVMKLDRHTVTLVDQLPEVRDALLDRVRTFDADLGPVGHLAAAVLGRVGRRRRGEPEFQTDLDDMNPRPAACPDCGAGECRAHTPDAYGELVQQRADEVETPLGATPRVAVASLLANFGPQLLPAELAELDRLLDGRPAALAPDAAAGAAIDPDLDAEAAEPDLVPAGHAG